MKVLSTRRVEAVRLEWSVSEWQVNGREDVKFSLTGSASTGYGDAAINAYSIHVDAGDSIRMRFADGKLLLMAKSDEEALVGLPDGARAVIGRELAWALGGLAVDGVDKALSEAYDEARERVDASEVVCAECGEPLSEHVDECSECDRQGLCPRDYVACDEICRGCLNKRLIEHYENYLLVGDDEYQDGRGYSDYCAVHVLNENKLNEPSCAFDGSVHPEDVLVSRDLETGEEKYVKRWFVSGAGVCDGPDTNVGWASWREAGKALLEWCEDQDR